MSRPPHTRKTESIFFCETPYHLLQAVLYAEVNKQQTVVYILGDLVSHFSRSEEVNGLFEYCTFTVIPAERFFIGPYWEAMSFKRPLNSLRILFRDVIPGGWRLFRILRSAPLHLFILNGSVDRKIWYALARSIDMHEDGSGNYKPYYKDRYYGRHRRVRELILTAELPLEAPDEIKAKHKLFDLKKHLAELPEESRARLISLYGFEQKRAEWKPEDSILLLTQALDYLLRAREDAEFRTRAMSLAARFVARLKEVSGLDILIKTHPNGMDKKSDYEQDGTVFAGEIPPSLPAELTGWLGGGMPYRMFLSFYSTAVMNATPANAVYRINMMDFDEVTLCRSMNDDDALSCFEKLLDRFIEEYPGKYAANQ